METPHYYAILTANVRYCKELSANEKLLYAEITSLMYSSGICWASNNYFSTLFNCTPQAISKWIKNLEKQCFISCEYIYKDGSKEIEKRIIKGINTDIKGINHHLGGYQPPIKDNIKESNNINYKEYLEAWNTFADICNKSPVIKITNTRQKHIQNRVKENKNFLDDFKQVLSLAESSSFLTNENWFDFNWIIMNDTNYIKVLECKYNDKKEKEVLWI